MYMINTLLKQYSKNYKVIEIVNFIRDNVHKNNHSSAAKRLLYQTNLYIPKQYFQ